VRRSGKLLLLSLLIYAFVGDLPRWFDSRALPPEFGRETNGQWPVVPEKELPGKQSVPASFPATCRWPRGARVGGGRRACAPGTGSAGKSRLFVHWRILAAQLVKSELWETLRSSARRSLSSFPDRLRFGRGSRRWPLGMTHACFPTGSTGIFIWRQRQLDVGRRG